MAVPQGTGSPQEPQGSAPPEGTQPNSDPKNLSLEDVNRAITGRLRDFEKKLDGRLTESFSGFGAKFDEFSKVLTALAPKQPETSEPDPKQPSGAPAKDPDVAALKGQLTELKNKMKAAEEARALADSRTREEQLRRTLAEKLGSLGVDAGRAKHAVGYLIDATKTVAIDNDHRFVFRDADGEPMDLDSGLRSWIASDDGKFYLPPRGTSGSGDNPKSTNGAQGRAAAPSDPRATAIALIAQKYRMGA